jgi:hypothetical protein
MIHWRGRGRRRSWPNKWYYPSICLEGLRKPTKSLSQDRRSLGRDLNTGHPEYEAGASTATFGVCNSVRQCFVQQSNRPVLYEECTMQLVHMGFSGGSLMRSSSELSSGQHKSELMFCDNGCVSIITGAPGIG